MNQNLMTRMWSMCSTTKNIEQNSTQNNFENYMVHLLHRNDARLDSHIESNRCTRVKSVHWSLIAARASMQRGHTKQDIRNGQLAALLGALERTQMRVKRVNAKTHTRTVQAVRIPSSRSSETRYLLHADAGASAARHGALEQPHRRVRCKLKSLAPPPKPCPLAPSSLLDTSPPAKCSWFWGSRDVARQRHMVACQGNHAAVLRWI